MAAKPGDWRMNVETLAAGQLRPHADSVYRYRVTFEHVPRVGPNRTDFVPVKWIGAVVIPILRGVCGWEDKPDWHQKRLDYANKVGDGVWEFQVTQPYCD